MHNVFQPIMDMWVNVTMNVAAQINLNHEAFLPGFSWWIHKLQER